MLTLSMSAFGGKADMTLNGWPMSANDPKRTFWHLTDLRLADGHVRLQAKSGL